MLALPAGYLICILLIENKGIHEPGMYNEEKERVL